MNTELIVTESDLNFGQAIEAVKEGNLIAREGWNGKNMFVFQRPKDTLSRDIIDQVKSINHEAKRVLLNQEREIKFLAYLCMFSAQGEVVNGWLASQTDMLAEDWCIVG